MVILYLSYDGLMEQLGQSQVFQYLNLLSKKHKILLLTYEKKTDWGDKVRRKATKEMAQQAGIHWIPLRYHKRPSALATFYDVTIGLTVSTFLVVRYRVDIVHARGYITSIIALFLDLVLGRKWIFDQRSFWPDDRVESGIWNTSSPVYKIFKFLERKYLLRADAIVVLTQKAQQLISTFPFMRDKTSNLHIVTTCVNQELFFPNRLDQQKSWQVREEDGLVFGYVGTVGGCYMFDEVLECIQTAQRMDPRVKLLVVNRGGHHFIQERIKAHGIREDRVSVTALDFKEVPDAIRLMDVGVFFITPGFYRSAAAPTKVGEFLACGVPCLTNIGISLVEEIFANGEAGVLLKDFSRQSMERGLHSVLKLARDKGVSQRCVAIANQRFSLHEGVDSYERIYDLIGGPN